MEAPSKAELLAKYAQDEPKLFEQWDGWHAQHGDALDYDDDGYVVCSCDTFELMQGSDVRILIDPDMPREEVLHLLHMMLGYYKREYCMPNEASGLPRGSEDRGLLTHVWGE